MQIAIDLFVAELRRSWLIFKRYPVQTVTGMMMTTLLFLALVFGAKYMIAGPASAFGSRLDEIIVGYVLWNIMIFAMGEISMGLQGEAQVGTLEQLFLSPISAIWIFLIRALANQALILVLNMGVLGIILLVTGNRLSFPPALFLPLGVMLGGVYGLGFVLGSLSLMYKRVEALLGMSQFLLMALVVVPFETWETPVARFLPLVPGAILMRDLMARSLPLDWTGLAVAAVNSAVYFILGLTVFHWMEKQTKRKGLLGSY